MNVLTLVGSTRTESLNRRLADAAHAALPDGVSATLFADLAAIPFYSEDLDTPQAIPAAAAALREAVEATDALILITPEYNGSVSAVLKNAIDWLSRPRGASAIADKPAVVLAASASPRGAQWAREDAVRILKVAGADVRETTVGVPSAYNAFDENGRLTQAELEQQLRDAVHELVEAVAPAAA